MHTKSRKITPSVATPVAATPALFQRCEAQVLIGKNNRRVKVITRSQSTRIDTTSCVPSW